MLLDRFVILCMRKNIQLVIKEYLNTKIIIHLSPTMILKIVIFGYIITSPQLM